MKNMFKYYGILSIFFFLILVISCNYGTITFDEEDNTNNTTQTGETNTNFPGILGSITNSYAYRWSDNILWKVQATSVSNGTKYVSDITPGSNSLIYKVVVNTNDLYTLIAFLDANQNDALDTSEWTTLHMQNGTRQMYFGTNSISNINFEVFLPGQRSLPSGTYHEVSGIISNHVMDFKVAATNETTNMIFYSLLSNAKDIGYFSYQLEPGTYDIFIFIDIYPNNGIYNYNNPFGTNEDSFMLSNDLVVSSDITNLIFSSE